MVVIIFAAIVGVMLGLLGGGVFVLLPWTVAGLVIGYLSKTRKESIISGVVFGFLLSFLFMVHGYQGKNPITQAIPLFLGLGLFGALCGTILSFVSFTLKKRFKK